MNKEAIKNDEMLDRIFDITHSLYSQMCTTDNNAKNNHSEIFRLITELGSVIVNADRASFWKWDKDKHELWTTAAVCEDRIIIPENTGLVGKALSMKKAIVTNDPYNCPDFNSDVDKKTGYVTNSIMVMPISNCKGEFIGVFQAINKHDENGFDLEEDQRRLSLAAFICGIALESDTFLDDSLHDKLTKLKNRIAFHNDYEYLRSHSCGCEKRALFICDIDFFKKINDTYGHNAGDEALRHVSSILGSSIRSCDGVYRWGGEEFIVLLSDASLDDAVAAAEKIRKTIMESVCVFESTEIKMTMSFGCTELDLSLSAEDNIKVADEKLYTAKQTGRNRVIA